MSLIIPSSVNRGRPQEINLVTHEGKVLIQLSFDAAEIVLEPAQAMEVAQALINMATELNRKFVI